MAKRKINKAGLALIKHFESLKLTAYQDSVGIWTIGWGHTGSAHNDGTVKKGRKITRDEAESLLMKDLSIFEEAVESCLDVKVNSNQFSALVSFSFNLGSSSLNRSTLLKKLNADDPFGAAKEFKRWSNAGGQRLAGLVRRRISERNLFCSFEEPVVEKLPDNWEDIYRSL